MPYTEHDRLIALAAMYQAASCVRRIATKGTVDTELMEPCIFSLFQTDPASVPEIYGQPGVLAPGVRELIAQLAGKQPRDLELTRYLVTLLKLERVLAARKVMVGNIADGIEEARAKLAHFPLLHPNVLAHLADVYSQTVSRLQPRIMVRGEPAYLQNADNQNRIRALLLAAIRAAWLWRQVGGNRWKILFGRKRLLEIAQAYLARSYH